MYKENLMKPLKYGAQILLKRTPITFLEILLELSKFDSRYPYDLIKYSFCIRQSCVNWATFQKFVKY